MSIFNPTLDGIVRQFDRLAATLSDHAGRKYEEVARHNEAIADYQNKAQEARTEAERAAKIAQNVKTLIAA